jgi:hypothetical protein
MVGLGRLEREFGAIAGEEAEKDGFTRRGLEAAAEGVELVVEAKVISPAGAEGVAAFGVEEEDWSNNGDTIKGLDTVLAEVERVAAGAPETVAEESKGGIVEREIEGATDGSDFFSP